jgi:TonB family protein
MAEMREIKSYSTAFLMSLAVHAFVLLLIIVFSKASLNAHKIVVIDLTLIDPVTAGAAVAGDKKASDVFEPKTKHQKEVVEDVESVMGQNKHEAKEEREKTEGEVTQSHETNQVNEQIPAVKTVAFIQDTKQDFVSEDQGVSKRAGTLLSRASETAGTSLKEKGATGTNEKQVIGNGSNKNGGVMKGYLRSHLSYIRDMIQRNITYPDIARRNGWMGKVTVSFIIAHNGCVRDIEVVRSSGFGCLDKNAVEAVEHSSPFPHPPVEARIIIPILYELH